LHFGITFWGTVYIDDVYCHAAPD